MSFPFGDVNWIATFQHLCWIISREEISTFDLSVHAIELWYQSSENCHGRAYGIHYLPTYWNIYDQKQFQVAHASNVECFPFFKNLCRFYLFAVCAFLVKVSVINNSMCIYRTTEIIKLKVTCSQNCIQLKVRGKRFFPLSTKWNPNILSVQLNSIDIE